MQRKLMTTMNKRILIWVVIALGIGLFFLRGGRPIQFTYGVAFEGGAYGVADVLDGGQTRHGLGAIYLFTFQGKEEMLEPRTDSVQSMAVSEDGSAYVLMTAEQLDIIIEGKTIEAPFPDGFAGSRVYADRYLNRMVVLGISEQRDTYEVVAYNNAGERLWHLHVEPRNQRQWQYHLPHMIAVREEGEVVVVAHTFSMVIDPDGNVRHIIETTNEMHGLGSYPVFVQYIEEEETLAIGYHVNATLEHGFVALYDADYNRRIVTFDKALIGGGIIGGNVVIYESDLNRAGDIAGGEGEFFVTAKSLTGEQLWQHKTNIYSKYPGISISRRPVLATSPNGDYLAFLTESSQTKAPTIYVFSKEGVVLQTYHTLRSWSPQNLSVANDGGVWFNTYFSPK